MTCDKGLAIAEAESLTDLEGISPVASMELNLFNSNLLVIFVFCHD